MRPPNDRLEDILDSINLVEHYVYGLTKKNFLKSQQVQDAVLRRIEIIGEAVKYLPLELKRKHTNIPWNEISDMRNIIVHEYFGVDLELTWKTIKIDIPILKKQLTKIMDAD